MELNDGDIVILNHTGQKAGKKSTIRNRYKLSVTKIACELGKVSKQKERVSEELSSQSKKP